MEVATVHDVPSRANDYKIDVTIGGQFVVGTRARNRFKIEINAQLKTISINVGTVLSKDREQE